LDEVYKLKEVTPLWTYKYDIHRWNHKFK